MTPDNPLLRAVIADPDDDAPRLVLADWLDERNQPERAGLIRGQIALAGLPGDSATRRELAYCCRRLLDGPLCQEWVADLVGGPADWRFCRGFVDWVEWDAATFAEDRGESFAWHPIRRVAVTGSNADVGLLDLVPAEPGLAALDLTGANLTPAELPALTRVPGLRRLRTLSLQFNRLGDSGVDVLCGEDFFNRLSLLRLGANPFTDAGRARLREHFGDRVTFECEREPDHLYRIIDDYFTTGTGRRQTQLFYRGCEAGPRAVVFDHAGNAVRVARGEWGPLPEDSREREAARESAKQALLRRLGFKPAPIRVKRFRFPEGDGIRDFCRWWMEAFDETDDPEIEPARRWLERWMAEGQFAYDFGRDDYWLDRTGEVTDT